MPRIPIPSLKPLPGWVWPLLAILTALSFLPLALVARERATRVDRTRLRIVPDMDQQPKHKAQSADPIFADGRAARPVVPGTVARGEARLDDQFFRGVVGGDWTDDFPLTLTSEVLRRGQARYGVYCAPCHGLGGYGDGIVNARAERLQEGTWTPPSSFHDATGLARPVGHLFNTVSNGIRRMPAYGPQIPERDRWAIVAYVRALQRSQGAAVEDVPPAERGGLR